MWLIMPTNFWVFAQLFAVFVPFCHKLAGTCVHVVSLMEQRKTKMSCLRAEMVSLLLLNRLRSQPY